MGFTSNSSQPRKRGRASVGCGAAILIIMAFTFVVFPLLRDGWDALVDAPWAHALNGRPTLTGIWTGEFTYPSGIEFAVLLDIHRARNSDGTYYNERKVGEHIDGQAQWCDSQGRHIANIPIAGEVPPSFTLGYRDHLDQVHIVLDYVNPPPTGGILPHEFNGGWQVDTLTTKPKFAESNGENLVVTASDSDPANLMNVILKKGDQNTFDNLCKKINGSNS